MEDRNRNRKEDAPDVKNIIKLSDEKLIYFTRISQSNKIHGIRGYPARYKKALTPAQRWALAYWIETNADNVLIKDELALAIESLTNPTIKD